MHRASIQNKKMRDMQSGFSLVELMVSLTIFSIVMTVSIGTLLVLIDANAKAQALYSSMTNMSYVMDSITRNIRTGYDHYCGPISASQSQENTARFTPGSNDCTNGGVESIAFTRESDDIRIGYRLKNNRIEQNVATDVNNTRTKGWVAVTADDVRVDSFEFKVVGTDDAVNDGDSTQPRISLFIDGKVNNGLETDTDFSLQTTVTGRILDY